jgi:hypothetical protein
MYLQYGSVTLKIIDLLRFDRQAILTPDGADLLYTRVTLGVSAVYAPGGVPAMASVTELSQDTDRRLGGLDTTADLLVGNPRGRDPQGLLDKPKMEHDKSFAGKPRVSPTPLDQQHSGPETDAELHRRLMMPRQKLILWAYDKRDGLPIRWLESPRGDMATDATVGPTPLQNPVISASGEPNSIGVYFEIQTDLTPCPIGSDRLVLSHRWRVAHGHDENQYLTRTITGVIVFNGGYIRTFGTNIGDVAAQFVAPVPVGFTRGLPMTEESEDGLTIRYTVTDTDPTVMFSPGDSGATQISIQEVLTYTNPNGNTAGSLGI